MNIRIFLAALLLGLLTSACGDSAMAPEPTIPDGDYPNVRNWYWTDRAFPNL